MNLNIKYFGLLTEVTLCSEETVPFSKATVSELLDLLFEKHPDLKNKDFQVALNNEIVSKDTLITANELALLPPFSGG
ncbi:MAG: MoaD/ThiS family protein [Chlorobi bacterium]|nr:MoaD/ThiS family protein [Chlorobiota bacterium]